MNHLFHQISWQQYLAAALVAAIIYYVFVILRCYRPELENLQRRIQGHKQGDQLQALQYQPAEEEAITTVPLPAQSQHPQEQQSISDTDILAVKLKACIAKAADKPYAPAILILQLKQILQEHQHIAADQRPQISHLVVNECEKTGTALLTEDEVDQWWER